MKAFESLVKYYQGRDIAAREWKKNGGKVVGYFCNSVPEEFIMAAGFFPVRISGDPWGDRSLARKYFLPRSKNREEFVHSMLNRLLTGEYDFLDYLVIPHARDTIRRLYVLMVELKGSDPSFSLPELHFLDVLHTPFYMSSVYNRLQMLDFKEVLEQWSGGEIRRESLSEAIATTNENKMLLKKVAELRASVPPRISGVEALQLIGSSMFMSKKDHNKLLKDYLAHSTNQSYGDGVRIYVAGSPMDNLQLYKILESSGVIVVAEDNCWGNRYSDVPIDGTLDPLEAIIDRYHNKSPCSRNYPMSARVDYCLRNAIEARAQGVIFNTYEKDGAEALETPAKRKALEAKGIPSLYLKNQPYLIKESGQIIDSIKQFVKEIKSKSEIIDPVGIEKTL